MRLQQIYLLTLSSFPVSSVCVCVCLCMCVYVCVRARTGVRAWLQVGLHERKVLQFEKRRYLQEKCNYAHDLKILVGFNGCWGQAPSMMDSDSQNSPIVGRTAATNGAFTVCQYFARCSLTHSRSMFGKFEFVSSMWNLLNQMYCSDIHEK